MAFVERKIEVSIKLVKNPTTNQPSRFDESRTDTVTFADSRMMVRVQNAGGLSGSEAQIAVWGLTPNLIDQLATLGIVIAQVPRNLITVMAGDSESGMSKVFVGTIQQAYADYNNAPDVPFRFECLAGASENATSYPASSYTGGTDVATILSAIAKQMKWGFENNGVKAQLSNPYLKGSAIEQVRAVAQAVQINASLINDVLVIWPRYGHRAGDKPLVAPPPDGAMIGYPSYTQQGILVRNLFNPSIKQGGQIEIRSSLKKASGTWTVRRLDLALDAVLPAGLWEMTMHAYNFNFRGLPPR